MDALDSFLENLIAEGLYQSNLHHLKFYLDFLFRGVEIARRSLLDVGGGSGLYSLYAAHLGASRVLCLEPELEGSSQGAGAQLERLSRQWVLGGVELSRTSLQAYEPKGEAFDCLLLHESVNHLDETACMNLLRSAEARRIYQELFEKLAQCARPGATLILCDCSPYNLFPLMGRPNPLNPTIEWHKHHTPRRWIEVLSRSGFENPRVRWTPPFRRLGRVGQFILSNEIMSFFLTSRFRLTMSKRR